MQTVPGNVKNLPTDSLYSVVGFGINDLDNPPYLRLQYAQIGLERANQNENDTRIAEFNAKIAVIYAEMGMNQKALTYALKARNYARKTKDARDDIWALYRLAEIHAILSNYDLALSEAREALQLSRIRNSQIEIGWSHNQLGEIYRRQSQLDSAAYYYQQAVAVFEGAQFTRGISFARQNLGTTYAAQKKFQMALQEFSIASAIGEETDVLFELEQGYAMVDIILNLHSLDSALVYANGMHELAKKGDYPYWQQRFHYRLASLYHQNEEWEKAWQYRLKADSLKEIQTGERVRMQSQVTDHLYRLQLLQAEHEIATQQNKNQILLWISILIVAGLLGVVALIQITKNNRIRKINQSLSQKNDHLDELIGEKDIWINLMAHDLKAPLNSISGLIDLLKDDSLPAELKEQVLGNISRSVTKGSELISQLLEISQLESSDEKADIQKTEIGELVRETEKSFQAAAENKHIQLQPDLPENPVFVETDPLHVQRILENFVSNALKFSPENKSIYLSFEEKAKAWGILVRDEGPGLSVSDQENLFKKFKRLSAQPTAGESSTGLGLSIVKQLADRIHANIEVRSKEGEGATFILWLPR